MKIMDYDHSEWQEFIRILGDKILINGCSMNTDRPNTKEALQEIGGIDIEKTLSFLNSKGGDCDCRVLLRVIAPWEEDFGKKFV